MVTWSNTLVYSCEYVCFVVLFYLVNVFFYVSCVVWCLLTCSTFRCNWCRVWISGMNICMCVKGRDILLLPLDIYAWGVYRLVWNCMFLFSFFGCSYRQNSPCNLLLTERNQNFSLDEGMFQLDKMEGIQNYVGYAHLWLDHWPW